MQVEKIEQFEESQALSRESGRSPLAGGWIRNTLSRALNKIEIGMLTVVLPDGSLISGGGAGPAATIVLRRWRPILRLWLEGDLGFAEAYIAGDWSTPDLRALLTLAAHNQTALNGQITGAWPRKILARLHHLANANTRRGSRRNIRAHYDLGNDFYAAWLDQGMSYSSALYTTDDLSLEAAQTAKQALTLDMLGVQPGEHVLEIGCGWGGLMERIASHGARVTGLTLSPAQFAYAQQRLHRAACSGTTDVLLQDYRDAEGAYDRVVSVEMFEAVGQAYWPVFFETLHARLKPNGVAALQIITIDESRFASYASQPDFIQAHIFPGGMLPTKAILTAQAEQAGLKLVETRAFGGCYAKTLAEWSQRFERAWPRLREQGFNEAFRRKWRYYLAYCEAGFRAGTLDVGIYRFVKAD